MKLYFIIPLLIQKVLWIPWIPTRFFLSFGGHWKVYGLENLKGIDKPVIFACNHTSEMDPFFIPASLHFLSRFSPIFYTSREKAFYSGSGWRRHFYGGIIFKIFGSYPVTVGLNNYEKSMANQIKILRDGGSLCIFPEGGITPDGNIRPAKGGVAYLAHATGATIIPVYFGGTYRITFGHLLGRRRNISIKYGKPMRSTNVLSANPSLDDFKNYAAMIMGEVERLKS